jgi:hypothetical protein
VPLRLVIALAAALALADASVVTLALPPIWDELDATVEGVAAVIGVYTLALAIALPAAEWLRRRSGTRTVGAAGLGLFALASAGCGAADSLEGLIALRAMQAIGGAAALVATFDLLGAGRDRTGTRVWTAAAIFGTAIGPALGGALTEAFDWRAIFLTQAPVAALAAVLFLVARPAASAPAAAPSPERRRWPVAPTIALALVSAALTAVLFLLVLLLVTGWSLSPLGAAATVSILPVVALAAYRIPGPARTRAAAGCALLGGGVLGLAFLPEASVGWTIVPQVLAGAGMGLALPALAGELLPERSPGEAAALLSMRHVGVTLALVVLAPITSDRIDLGVDRATERGAALVLDAKLPPLEKIDLAGALVADLDPIDPRESLKRQLDRNAGKFDDDDEERQAYATLRRRADETLVSEIDGAFTPAFLITGGLALVAALALLTGLRLARDFRTVAAAGAAALAVPLALGLAKPSLEPDPVTIADPCQKRELPSTGGIGGFVQDAALVALDRAACRFGTSREELALALVDKDAAREYEREHGVNPRSLDLLGGIIGL